MFAHITNLQNALNQCGYKCQIEIFKPCWSAKESKKKPSEVICLSLIEDNDVEFCLTRKQVGGFKMSMRKEVTLEELKTICKILDYEYGNLYDNNCIIGHFFNGYIELYTYETDWSDIDWNEGIH